MAARRPPVARIGSEATTTHRHVPLGDGQRMTVMDRGPARGPTVLALHGFLGSRLDWVGLAQSLGDGLRLLAPDLPGHGASRLRCDRDAYTLDATLDAVLRTLDRLQVERMDLLGYSMGGRIALALAAREPARVRSLVLEGASAGLADEFASAERRRSDARLAALLEREGLERFLDRWQGLPLFASQRSLPPPVAAAQRARRRHNRAGELARALRGLSVGAQPYLGDAIAALSLPTLTVAGALDEKYAALAEQLAASMPRARAVVVAGAGHNVHLERPEAFAALVTEFYAGLTGDKEEATT